MTQNLSGIFKFKNFNLKTTYFSSWMWNAKLFECRSWRSPRFDVVQFGRRHRTRLLSNVKYCSSHQVNFFRSINFDFSYYKSKNFQSYDHSDDTLHEEDAEKRESNFLSLGGAAKMARKSIGIFLMKKDEDDEDDEWSFRFKSFYNCFCHCQNK